MSFPLNTPILGMSKEEYHGTEGTWSSSQLKTILEDEELFHRKYIAKTEPKVEAAAFDVGTYYHTGILEPHKLKEEFAIYPGNIRRGKAWEKFKKIHGKKGKILLTKSMEDQGKLLIEATKRSPIAMNYVKRGTPEVAMFIVLAIEGGRIYAPTQELVLTPTGWARHKGKIPKSAIELVVKVCADSIDLADHEFILDLKSTTGNAKKEFDVRQSVSNYGYDLSAAMYLDVMSAGLEKEIKIFRWVFASKEFGNSKTWKAHEDQILIGRAKWATAALRIAKGIACDWQFEDEEGLLMPNDYERAWLSTPFARGEAIPFPTTSRKKKVAKKTATEDTSYLDL